MFNDTVFVGNVIDVLLFLKFLLRLIDLKFVNKILPQ